MDWVRWIYYYFMIYSGIADTYRYEQFIKKNDALYNIELLLFSCNLNSHHKKKVLENFLIVTIYSFVACVEQVNKIISLINLTKSN